MRTAPKRVVVIEDDPATLDLFAIALGEDGYVCERFTCAEQAAARLAEADALIADLAGARELAGNGSSVPLPLLIVSADAAAAEFARRIGARHLPKPFELDRLSEALRELLERT